MRSGGARYGAGRPASHVTVESLPRIDIGQWWRRDRRLVLGEEGSSVVRAALGNESARIAWRTEADAIIVRAEDGAHQVVQRVPIVRMPLNFGGERSFFGCPECDRRAVMLFLRTGRFACRRCAGATYQSRQESEMARGSRRTSNLERRLDDLLARDGHRASTHLKLLRQIAASKNRFIGATDRALDRMKPRWARE